MAPRYVFSWRADDDMVAIVVSSLAEFGEAQTDIYSTGLGNTLSLLADNPDMGSMFVHDRTGRSYRRHRHESHVIYYRKRKADIFIVRILHVKMIPEKHLGG